MAIRYRTRGFMLKKEAWGEADQIFTLYTKDFGKIKVLARAIRKIKSKLRAGIGPFYLSEIEFIQGKIYKTLTDVIVIDKFNNVRNDLEKLGIAIQIAGISDDLIGGEEKDETIWNLLIEVFNKFNKQPFGESLASVHSEAVHCELLDPGKLPASGWSAGGGKIIYYYFLWNLLSILGYQINLYNCALCQEKLLPQKLYFNLEKGGIICLECFKKIKQGREISPDAIKILRIFLKKDWKTLSRLKITDFHKKSLKKISKNYFSYYQKEDNLV